MCQPKRASFHRTGAPVGRRYSQTFGPSMKSFHRYLVAISLCFTILLPSLPARADDSPVLVRYGTSQGECVGFCWKSIEVSSARAVFSATAYHPTKKLAPIRRDASLSPQEQKALQSLLASTSVDGLAERIGCPDCGAAGAEWVEVTKNGQRSARVTFEKGKPPAQLESLTRWLGALQARFPVPDVR